MKCANFRMLIYHRREFMSLYLTIHMIYLFDLDSDVWNEFVANCRANIHVVLCTTPTEFSRWICHYDHNPFNGTHINWMHQWSENALVKVASKFLMDHPHIPETHQESVIGHVVHVHKNIFNYTHDYRQKYTRINHFTPKHYVEFINSYLKSIGK